ncbi:MAG: gamma-glutamylcyclotransferase [Pontiellaceae bacterium]|nr:gamma-glutamylcyclotransferase [Pontiellaceae bacterium]MBN2783297.1 gamma-glutamylcyclotransferase [Pontiellaceae bacterium]
MKLFAYGTLMWPEVLEAVIGHRLSGAPDALLGYCRLRVRGEHYPVVVPEEGGRVEGILYDNLSESDFRHLDHFEGEEYERKILKVGETEAAVYVLSDRWRHIAEDSAWHPEQMLPQHLAAFQAEYKGWKDL